MESRTTLDQSPDDVPYVLFVCDGNICRSPFAAALFRHELERRGRVGRVESAGFLLDGEPMDPRMERLLAPHGITPPAHRSRIIDADLIDGAALILTMTGRQVIKVASTRPDALPRTFTLREFTGLLSPENPFTGDDQLGAVLARLDRRRQRDRLLRSDPSLEIEDPHRRRRKVYKQVAEQISGQIGLLADALLQPMTEPAIEPGR